MRKPVKKADSPGDGGAPAGLHFRDGPLSAESADFKAWIRAVR